MRHNPRFITLKRLPLLAAVLAAPLAGPLVTSAQADPPDHAPAYGYYGKKNKGQHGGHGGQRGRHDRRSDDENGADDNGSGYSNGDDNDNGNGNGYPNPGPGNGGYNGGYDGSGTRQRRSFEGVVTRDLGGDRFEMRAGDNSVFTVRAQQGEPQRLSAGDRVRVEGYFRNVRDDNRSSNDDARADFVAQSVQILSDTNGGDIYGGNYGSGYGIARHVSFPATVLNRDGSRSLTVRGDNGRTYTVETRSNTVRVNDGDRVRVEGTSRSGVVTNARVVLLQNTDNPIYNATGSSFLGRVTRVDSRRNLVTVREDGTGRTFTFHPHRAAAFFVGGRVRGTLSSRDGRSVLTQVTRL